MRTTLPASVTTPAAARAVAREAVERGRATVRIDDVALVVSELVTNAVLHGAGDITLHLTVEQSTVHVEVIDADPVTPEAVEIAPDAESGRGLLLVSKVAKRWGVEPAGTGKVVWAELAS